AIIPLVNRLFYAAIRDASNIPTTLIEILAADDDDGDLANGTPHECTIRAVFGAHGMRTVVGRITDAPGALVAAEDETSRPIELRLEGLRARCPSDPVQSQT